MRKDTCAILLMILLIVFVSIIGGMAYSEPAIGSEQKTLPIYVILKEPILIDLEICQNGNCTNVGKTGMIYKIHVSQLVYRTINHNVIRIVPYDPRIRQKIGHIVEIPVVNIRCISYGENEIKGHMHDSSQPGWIRIIEYDGSSSTRPHFLS